MHRTQIAIVVATTWMLGARVVFAQSEPPAVLEPTVVVGVPMAAPPAPMPMMPPPNVPIGMVTITSAGGPEIVTLAPVGPIAYVPGTQNVCATPCSLRMPTGAYTLVAQSRETGARQTQALMLTPGTLAVRISPAHRRGPAIALIAAGAGVALVLGLTFLALGLEYSAIDSSGTFFRIDPTPYYALAAGSAVVGAALIVPGVLLLGGSRGAIETSQARATRPRLVGFGATPILGGAAIGATIAF